MLLMAWGADQELSEQRHRKLHMGHFLHYRWVGVCRLWPEFEGLGRGVILITVVGIASYLVFLAAIDIPI